MPTDRADPPPTHAWLRGFRGRLRAWYRRSARDLPWRRDPQAYRVWVSEVMLQQTQVETVKPYYERFLERFPTVTDLAAAGEQDVLRLWEGLGYYRRARSLHAAAKVVVAEHGGELPASPADLQRLPGIGRYTAGAIASIAYNRRAPILEANTIRLLTRLTAYRGDATTAAGQKRLWAVAEELLPRTGVGEFNQALMELGALVCTPAEPACDDCPVATLCRARTDGVIEDLRPTTRKQTLTEVREAAVVVWNSGAVLLRRCGEGERWAGLWDFPRFAIDGQGPLFTAHEVQEKLRRQTGVEAHVGPLIHTLKHGVTRYRITLECYRAESTGGRLRAAFWVRPEELAARPLSATGRKLARLLG